MKKWLTSLPLSFWLGAAMVLIITVGWFFNTWQVIGVQDSFPYLKVSKPLPEVHRIEPESAISGETITIQGSKFEAFTPGASRVVIGATAVEPKNWVSTPWWKFWQHKSDSITFEVPELLTPGRYPVRVQISDRQSVGDLNLEVRFLPLEDLQAIQSDERILILVARFSDSKSTDSLQTDLLNQIDYELSRDDQTEGKVLVRAWPANIPDNVPNKLREVAATTKARLIVFGRKGGGENYYPRIYWSPPESDIFHSAQQQLTPASQVQLQVDDTYELSAQAVREPLGLTRFLLALSLFQLGDYEGARELLQRLRGDQNLTALDSTSLDLALGRVTVWLGTDVLEQPYRTDADRRRGESLLEEGMDHLKQAAESLLGIEARRHQAAYVYLALGLATQSLPFRRIQKKQLSAIKFYEKALENMDCEEDFFKCMLAYENQGGAYEWIASTEWDRGISDDQLETAIVLTEKALQMHTMRSAENDKRADKERIDPEIILLERVLIRNNIGICKSHLYRGDRDKNLWDSLALSQEALPVFQTRGAEMLGRVALTYNAIGNALMNLQGDRPHLFKKAKEAYADGLKLVGPKNFPEFYQLLQGNMDLVNRLIAENFKMREGETAGRYEAEFDRLYRSEIYPEAEQVALDYLNWSWREFRSPGRYTAMAHNLLARIAEHGGGTTLALQHAIAARTILSNSENWDDKQFHQVHDLERTIGELLTAHGYGPMEVKAQLQKLVNGYQMRTKYKEAGDALLESNPKKAIKTYTLALLFYPYDPLTLINRAIAKMQVKDREGSLEDLSAALIIYPDDNIARFNRAQVYLQASLWSEALEDIDAAISNGGDSAYYFAVRGFAYEGLGKTENALADYQISLEKAPGEVLRDELMERIERLGPTR